MVVFGITSDLYLINNPIWVDIRQVNVQAQFVEVSVRDLTAENPSLPNTLRLYHFEGNIEYDLQEIVKAMFSEPKAPVVLSGTVIWKNFRKLEIEFREYVDGQITSVVQFTKTFLRGGLDAQGSNFTLPQGTVLKESALIPQWGGYPVEKHYISMDRKILGSSIVPDAETERMRELGCNPLYVKFLNTKGGYSFWLFENYTEKTTASSLGVAKRREGQFSLGSNVSVRLEAETRLKRSYFNLMKALVLSPEVYVYDRYGVEWASVTVEDTEFNDISSEDIQEIVIGFDVETSLKPSLIW